MIRSATAVLALTILPTFFAPAQLEAQVQERERYEVVIGNTLWDLAQRFYGNPYDWRRIWEANRATIANPDLIYPGQVILVPDGQGGFIEVTMVREASPGAMPSPPPVQEARSSQRTRFYPDTTLAGEEVRREAEARYVAVPEQIVLSAPFIVAASAVDPVGTIAGFAGAEEVRRTRASALPYDRLTLDMDGRPTVGSRFLAYRIEMREGLGEIAIPTSVLTVTSREGDTVIALLELAFDRTVVGNHLVPLPAYESRTGVTPVEVVNGMRATVIGYVNQGELQSRGAPLFIDQGARDGVQVGDEFSIRWEDQGNVTEGVAQVIRVDADISTARVITLRNAVFIDQVELVQSRRMPGR